MGWVKGQSGNPGGRKKSPVKALAEKNSADAFNVIIKLAMDKKQDARVRLEAAKYVVDRDLGRPTQAVSGPDEGPIDLKHSLSARSMEIIAKIIGGPDDAA